MWVDGPGVSHSKGEHGKSPKLTPTTLDYRWFQGKRATFGLPIPKIGLGTWVAELLQNVCYKTSHTSMEDKRQLFCFLSEKPFHAMHNTTTRHRRALHSFKKNLAKEKTAGSKALGVANLKLYPERRTLGVLTRPANTEVESTPPPPPVLC